MADPRGVLVLAVVRITAPHLPIAVAGNLEDLTIPAVKRIAATLQRRMEEAR